MRLCSSSLMSLLTSVALLNAEQVGNGVSDPPTENEQQMRQRIESARIRAEVASGRVFVAYLRVKMELTRAKLDHARLRELGPADGPGRETPTPGKQDVVRIYDSWRVAAALSSEIQTAMQLHGHAKPHPTGVPGFADTIGRNSLMPPKLPTSMEKIMRYAEAGAFATEQAAQVAEIAEDQAIALADLALHQLNRATPFRMLGTWRSLGPTVIPKGEGYNRERIPVSGRVTSLAVDPFDTQVIYLGSAMGGVWKSTNRGASWRPLTDGQPCSPIGALAVSLQRPGLVLAGTGEANVAFRHLVAPRDRITVEDVGCGLLRSTNSGETWNIVGHREFDGAAFAQLTVNSEDPNLILASTTRGLFRSLDAGMTWTNLNTTLPVRTASFAVTSAVFDRAKPTALYIAAWGEGMFRTEDIRDPIPVWQRLSGGLPLSNVSRTELATGRSTVVAMAANMNSYLRGVYVSSNGGADWEHIVNAPDVLQGQGFYNIMVGIHPEMDEVFYIGGVGKRGVHASSLYRVERMHDNWKFTALGASLHVDFHAIAFDPQHRQRFYVGNDGGVWRTEDAGSSWASCNDGLEITQVLRIAQHPKRPDFVVAGTQDNGTILFRGSSAWEHADDGDGGWVAIDQQQPETIFSVFSPWKLFRSERSGKYGTFVPAHPQLQNPSTAFFAPFDLDRSDSSRLIMALDRLYLSNDGGRSWAAIAQLPDGPSRGLRSVYASYVVFPQRDLIYLGSSRGKVWRLDLIDGSWGSRLVFDATEQAGEDAFVTSILPSPRDPETVFLGLATTNHPGAWMYSHSTENEPPRIRALGSIGDEPITRVYSLAADYAADAVLFLSSAAGLFRSGDDGAHWERFDQGLPRVPVLHLEMHPTFRLIRAASYGRGVWERELAPEELNLSGAAGEAH